MTLAEQLNKVNALPQANEGKITLVDEGDNEIEFEGHGYLDEHPEGADRGGYVPFWFQGDKTAMYDVTACEWQ